jgi:hypothetical protein
MEVVDADQQLVSGASGRPGALGLLHFAAASLQTSCQPLGLSKRLTW